MEDPEKKKLAWSIYQKYPTAVAFLSTGEGKPLVQIFEHLQDLIASRSSEFEIVMYQPKVKDPEIWFIPREWDSVCSITAKGK